MMDHTPGQRQFTDLAKFETYVRGKYNFGDQEFVDYIGFLTGLKSELGAKHEAATVAAAQRLGATLASHDDTTIAQVATSRAHGKWPSFRRQLKPLTPVTRMASPQSWARQI